MRYNVANSAIELTWLVVTSAAAALACELTLCHQTATLQLEQMSTPECHQLCFVNGNVYLKKIIIIFYDRSDGSIRCRSGRNARFALTSSTTPKTLRPSTADILSTMNGNLRGFLTVVQSAHLRCLSGDLIDVFFSPVWCSGFRSAPPKPARNVENR